MQADLVGVIQWTSPATPIAPNYRSPYPHRMKPQQPKNDPKILTGIRLRSSLKDAGQRAAQKENRSFSNYMEQLLSKDLEAKSLHPWK